MSKKRTTLCSTVMAERKQPSSDTSAVDVASNHDAPTVGKPTEQTPDTFSIKYATEKVVELEVVNNVLLPRQRNTDKEPVDVLNETVDRRLGQILKSS